MLTRPNDKKFSDADEETSSNERGTAFTSSSFFLLKAFLSVVCNYWKHFWTRRGVEKIFRCKLPIQKFQNAPQAILPIRNWTEQMGENTILRCSRLRKGSIIAFETLFKHQREQNVLIKPSTSNNYIFDFWKKQFLIYNKVDGNLELFSIIFQTSGLYHYWTFDALDLLLQNRNNSCLFL